MATTTNYSWNLPTVGGSEDTWGTDLNSNWTALDTLLGGTNATEFAILDGLTATTASLNTASTHYVPSGGIIMWSGSVASVPSGWYLCDGTNGTPNLTGKFIVHADADSGGTYAPGDTGGADSVTLTEAQIPGHTHTFSGSTNTTGAHTHTVSHSAVSGVSAGGYIAGGSPTPSTTTTTSTAGDHAHTFSGTTASTGGGSSHENRPPYYALAYIMKA